MVLISKKFKLKRIYVDSSVRPSRQCARTARKRNQILGMIKRNFTFLDEDIVVRLYKQLIRPRLEYVVQAWNSHQPHFSKYFENNQKRGTRSISYMRGVASCDYRLKNT